MPSKTNFQDGICSNEWRGHSQTTTPMIIRMTQILVVVQERCFLVKCMMTMSDLFCLSQAGTAQARHREVEAKLITFGEDIAFTVHWWYCAGTSTVQVHYSTVLVLRVPLTEYLCPFLKVLHGTVLYFVPSTCTCTVAEWPLWYCISEGFRNSMYLVLTLVQVPHYCDTTVYLAASAHCTIPGTSTCTVLVLNFTRMFSVLR